jgi:hypothetical protein
MLLSFIAAKFSSTIDLKLVKFDLNSDVKAASTSVYNN